MYRKYISLKLHGGNEDEQVPYNSRSNTVIHISGPSGAGKSTIGNKLIKKFGDKIIVKDIDDLRWEFIKNEYGDMKIENFNNDGYQRWINDYVKRQIKPIVFFGLYSVGNDANDILHLITSILFINNMN